ncbi:MAG: GNAT family N-acetyltransferase [Candidatus Paceibacterota bacterium]
MSEDIKELIYELYDREWTRDVDNVSEVLSQNNVYYFFHKENNKIVGMAALYTVKLFTRNLGIIEEVVVLPEYRNKGIATDLMNQALKKVKELKLTCVELNVKEDKKYVQEFYKKFGFYNRTNIAFRLWINKK